MISMKIPRLVIAAPYSGAGKTTVTIGLMAALTKIGRRVQPFKIGPDYIDPGFHTEVTKNHSINLDNYLLDKETILDLFHRYGKDADISIIEGVMGLYDGIGTMAMEGSSAGMAQILKSPVIIVLPAQGMSTTAAAMIHGLKDFGNINVAGVILNKVSSKAYYDLLKDAIESHTGVKVLGRIPQTEEISLKSRHLGLVQSCEMEDKERVIDKLAGLIQEYIDLDAVLELANNAPELDIKAEDLKAKEPIIDVAVAHDEAFQFYYHENLNILSRLGARLRFFSPLKDRTLPDNISGLYLGGGYPEVYAKTLEENQAIRDEIRTAALKGLPLYAECGGYMYLHEKLVFNDQEYRMVGLFQGKAVMTKKLQNFGYAKLNALEDSCIFRKGDTVKSHEFHTSIIEGGEDQKLVLAQKTRNSKEIQWFTGSQANNAFGMYPHIYFPSNIKIAQNFMDQCAEFKETKV